MAVWLQIIGKRDFISFEKEREKLFDILSNISLDLSFLESTEFNSEYDPKLWTLDEKYNMTYFEYPLTNSSEIGFNSIRVIFNNPKFIEFSGPFMFFSEWFYLGNEFSGKIENGWRKIFKQIAKEYQMNNLVYISEWFYPTELIHNGEESVEELFERFKLNDAKEIQYLGNLNHNDFFLEKL